MNLLYVRELITCEGADEGQGWWSMTHSSNATITSVPACVGVGVCLTLSCLTDEWPEFSDQACLMPQL